MRFLHLADLHIGKRVNGFSMIEDQKYILQQLLELIEKEQVEGVWIAGDVYDKAVPSAEAVQLFDDFLTKLTKKQLPVFLISGNHDSPERLAFCSHILKEQNLYISSIYTGESEPVVLEDSYGKINIYLLPFLKPSMVRNIFQDDRPESFEECVKMAVERMQVNSDERNILLAHQFVTGAKRSDSEEVSVGGLDNVDAAVFEGFDYVALGHIHRFQTMGKETICYAGTPLKYSFSEASHQKVAVLVDILEKGNVKIWTRELVPARDLREIRGKYLEITARDFYKDTNTEDYLHITLTDEEDIPEVIGRLRAIYPNVMKVDYDNKRTRETREIKGAVHTEKKSPFLLFQEFYKLQNNQEMSEEQKEFVKKWMDF